MTQQATASLRYLRMTPRKIRLLADLVRGLSVNDARVQLTFSKKTAAKPLLKLVNSAVANATHNGGLKEETLKIAAITVDGGPMLKRWMPRAMGRATPIRKRTSHINITLSGEMGETKKNANNETVAAEVVATEEIPKAKKRSVKSGNKETKK